MRPVGAPPSSYLASQNLFGMAHSHSERKAQAQGPAQGQLRRHIQQTSLDILHRR